MVPAARAVSELGTMAWRCSGGSNDELVDNMWRNGVITDERVRDVMKRVSFGLKFLSLLSVLVPVASLSCWA